MWNLSCVNGSLHLLLVDMESVTRTTELFYFTKHAICICTDKVDEI